MNLSINKDLYQNIIKSNNHHITNKNITLRYCPAKDNKIGFVLPKLLGASHLRNLFKRRCRSAFINNKSVNKNIAVLVKPKTLDIKYKEINKIFSELYTG